MTQLSDRETPHTSAWFEALLRQNTQQAMHTMGIIKAASDHHGRERLDVCSICGDEPAPICRLTKPKQRPGWLATLRLCDDCRQIRRDHLGETHTPI